MWDTRVRSLGREDPLEKKWQPTPVLLAGESHGGRSLVGYSPWDRKESDTTVQLHFHFSTGKKVILRELKIDLAFKVDWISMNKRKGKEVSHLFLSCSLCTLGFPDNSVGKESACNAGDPGLIPELGRSAGEGIGYPLHILAWRIPWNV